MDSCEGFHSPDTIPKKANQRLFVYECNRKNKITIRRKRIHQYVNTWQQTMQRCHNLIPNKRKYHIRHGDAIFSGEGKSWLTPQVASLSIIMMYLSWSLLFLIWKMKSSQILLCANTIPTSLAGECHSSCPSGSSVGQLSAQTAPHSWIVVVLLGKIFEKYCDVFEYFSVSPRSTMIAVSMTRRSWTLLLTFMLKVNCPFLKRKRYRHRKMVPIHENKITPFLRHDAVIVRWFGTL